MKALDEGGVIGGDGVDTLSTKLVVAASRCSNGYTLENRSSKSSMLSSSILNI